MLSWQTLEQISNITCTSKTRLSNFNFIQEEQMNVCKSYNQRLFPRPTSFYPRHPTNYKFVNVTRHNNLIKIDYR